MHSLSIPPTVSASPLTNSSPSPVSPASNNNNITNVAPSSTGPLSNQQIEAVIQMATSSANPAATRDTRTQLFVGNLPYRVRWQDLKDLFRKAGTVLRADVSLGPDNRSRGYGTVLLASSEDATRAMEMFNGYNWQTRTLEVRPDRLSLDFEGPPTSTSVLAHSSPIPQVIGKPFPVPGLSAFGGSQLGDRQAQAQAQPLSSYLGGAATDELDPSKPFVERMRTASSPGSRSLFVGNLPFHCQWQDLKDLFRQAGSVFRADVALGPDGRSRGFGTVSFTNDVDAEKAVNLLNGYEYNGRVLKVHYDKFSSPAVTGLAPQSPLAPSGLASPSPTTQLHHPSHPHAHAHPSTGQSMHIPIPPTTTFEHMMAHYPPSPFDHPFGQVSPYDIYATHVHPHAHMATAGVGFAGSMVPPGYGVMNSSSEPPQGINMMKVQQAQGGVDNVNAAASVASPPSAVSSQSLQSSVISTSPVASFKREQLSDNIPGAAGIGVASQVSTVTAESTVAAPQAPATADATSATKTAATARTETDTKPQLQRQLKPKPKPSKLPQPTHPHPGPISLPSPSIHPFPVPLNSNGSGGGPISPMHGLGLPPITPSMPSFTFVPQNATPPPQAHFLSPGVGVTPFQFSPGQPPMSSPGAAGVAGFYHGYAPQQQVQHHHQQPYAHAPQHMWNVAPGAPLHYGVLHSPMGSPGYYYPVPSPHQGYPPPDPNKMDYFSVPPMPMRMTAMAGTAQTAAGPGEGYFPLMPQGQGQVNTGAETKREGSGSGSGSEENRASAPTTGQDGRKLSVNSLPPSSAVSSLDGSLGRPLLGSVPPSMGSLGMGIGNLTSSPVAKLKIKPEESLGGAGASPFTSTSALLEEELAKLSLQTAAAGLGSESASSLLDSASQLESHSNNVAASVLVPFATTATAMSPAPDNLISPLHSAGASTSEPSVVYVHAHTHAPPHRTNSEGSRYRDDKTASLRDAAMAAWSLSSGGSSSGSGSTGGSIDGGGNILGSGSWSGAGSGGSGAERRASWTPTTSEFRAAAREDFRRGVELGSGLIGDVAGAGRRARASER